MVTAGADADLPHQVGLPAPVAVAAGEDRDEARLQHVLVVAVPGVLVLAERVHGALAGEHARMDGARVDLLHLAVEALHPAFDGMVEGWGGGAVGGQRLGVVVGAMILNTVAIAAVVHPISLPIKHAKG